MATPLHHDQPQRAVQILKVIAKKHAEDPKNSELKKIGYHQTDTSSEEEEDLAYLGEYIRTRPSREQLYLRQRLLHQRPNSSSPNLASSLPAPSSTGDHRPHVVSDTTRAHTSQSPEDRVHQDESSLANSHSHRSRAVGTVEKNPVDVNGRLSSHLEPRSSYAVTPTDRRLLNAKDAEKHQALQSLVERNPHARSYRDAVIQKDLPGHANQEQHDDHDDEPHLQHEYFGSREDEKQRTEIKGCRVVETPQVEKQQSDVLDYLSTGDPDVGNSPTMSSHDHFPVPSLFKEQKQSLNLLTTSFLKQPGYDYEATDKADDDLKVSDRQPHAEIGSTPPQQQHQELSLSSSDDSYFHISKDTVERDYQIECHGTASSTVHQAKSDQQYCYRIVYDYSRAGVTLVGDSAVERKQSDGFEDQCSNEIDVKEGLNHVKSLQDNSRSSDLSARQYLDVESPPLFLGFNQSNTQFACGTSKGFRVYDVASMKEVFSSMIGGVGLVELLLSTNTMLLVGGGPNPSFPPNKVILWDCVKGAPCGESTQKFPILAVKARKDRLIIVLEKEVYIYNYGNARLLFRVNTTSNIKGLCAISMKEGLSVLACPGLKKGEVRIERIGRNRGREELPARESIVVSAHDSGLACVTLNLDGSLLATASDRGTLVRIFSTQDGIPLQELRRGVDRAEIYSISFSFSSDLLAVSSDKGTIHVFCLKAPGLKSADDNNDASSTVVRNPGSTLSFIKGVLPKYFSSEWSFAQFKLSEEMKSVVAFGQEKHCILVLGTNGSFYKCSFDSEHGGDMKQLECWNFMKSREATA